MTVISENTAQSIISESPEETISAGVSFAEKLRAGDIVLLEGDLGAGKTHFAKGIGIGLGIESHEVDSPTFAIVNEYEGRDYPVYHFDCYRIKNPREILQIGWEEYTAGDALCLIEWAENIAEFILEDAIKVSLSHLDSEKRKIQIIFPGIIQPNER